MEKIMGLLKLVAGTVMAFGFVCNVAIAQIADTIYTNGKIYTVNKAQPWAEAVAIKDGKFVAAGSAGDVESHRGDGTKVIDLEGKMAMPGLIDLHHHMLTVADGTSHLAFTKPGDLDSMLAEIKAYAKANPDLPLIRGEQWNLGVFPKDSPTKELLDAIVPDRPAYFLSQSGHSGWVNSKALELAGITADTPITKKFIFDKDEKTGEPNGTIREFAMAHLLQALPKTPIEAMVPRIDDLSMTFAKQGFTSLKLAEGRPHHVRAAAMAEDQKKLHVRLFVAWEWESHYNEFTDEEMEKVFPDWKSYQTEMVEPRYVKIFADGSSDTYTSLLYDDYEGRPGFKGDTHRSAEDLTNAVAKFNKLGLGVMIHAMGDATVGQVIDVFKEVRKRNGMNNAVLQLSHAPLANVEDLKKLATIEGVSVDFSPGLNIRHPIVEGTFVKPVGERRFSKAYNVRSAIENGLLVGFGTDFPSVLNPALNGFGQMQTWITRIDPTDQTKPALNGDQAISLEQAIRGYTLDATASLGFDWPEKLGSIEVGKFADFIVIDRNVFEVPISDLHKTRIELTILGGKVVYDGSIK
jgi:predicted amidohydrolase YtcJ